MSFSNRVTTVLDLLQAFKSAHVFNPWSDVDELDVDDLAPQRRVARLRHHFRCEPKVLLVGEAPGYQGCHYAGIPFTSERLLLEGSIPRVHVSERITKNLPRPVAEPSATIVWRTLYRLGLAGHTVMWNAFAWHPHKPGNLHSNRAPTGYELAAGAEVLRQVCRLFPGVEIVACGRIAQRALLRLDVPISARVRHPSMGGAAEFHMGMARVGDRVSIVRRPAAPAMEAR